MLFFFPNGRKQELPKQARAQKVGLLGIGNKASEILLRRDGAVSRTHVCKVPQLFPPDLVARLVKWASGASFFLSI